MKNTKLISVLLLSMISWASQAQTKNIVANPVNLNYRFQVDEPSRREAADPVLEYFNGKYYLFASKSGGYWSSPDLAEWTYIPCKTIATIEEYAPSILVLNDTLYYIASNLPRIFYTTNPDEDSWKPVSAKFEYNMTDPAFFKDDDTGKVYMYWGCSDKDPIMGVEINPADGFKSIGNPVVLIEHNGDKYGWEVPGKNNEEKRTGWNEGPCMNKHNGKYYLQYAAPGTEYRIYGDGVYVGDNPLGSFTYMENSPYSFKPGGFIGGAGHGHTFKDKYGNYWHVATMTISVRHMFERRLGLFPVYFSENGDMYAHNLWTDYPFYTPDRKVDFETENCSMNWNLLSYDKATLASSSLLPKFDSKYANDEQVETWWSAQTGDIGEWWQVDLGKIMEVKAIQVNFADQDFTNRASNSYTFYQYRVEISDDEQNWEIFIDRTQNTKDMPHELIVPDNPQKTRYIRITNTKNMTGKFSLSGFRVFGSGEGELPEEVSGVQAKRYKEDKRRILLSWDEQPNATGYIVRWGVQRDELKNATMVFTNQLEGGFFNRDSQYFFSVDVFNENGITHGNTIVEGFVNYGSPYGGTLRPVPGTIEAEDFNEGGETIGYYAANGGRTNIYRPDENIGIDEISEIIYIYNTTRGDFLNYTVDVAETGLYDMDCIASSASKSSPGGFFLEFNGEVKTNPEITTIPYGSILNFETTTAKNIFLTKGTNVMTFNIHGNLRIDKYIFNSQSTAIETAKQHSIAVYPNPSDGIFNIKSSQPGVLSISDIRGKTIFYDTVIPESIDISGHPAGIYILALLSDAQVYHTKLIKT